MTSMNPRRSSPCPSQVTILSAVRFTINTPSFEPNIRKQVNVTRSRGSAVSADRIEVTGVLMPV
jgi:hypothetical protein